MSVCVNTSPYTHIHTHPCTHTPQLEFPNPTVPSYLRETSKQQVLLHQAVHLRQNFHDAKHTACDCTMGPLSSHPWRSTHRGMVGSLQLFTAASV